MDDLFINWVDRTMRLLKDGKSPADALAQGFANATNCAIGWLSWTIVGATSTDVEHVLGRYCEDEAVAVGISKAPILPEGWWKVELPQGRQEGLFPLSSRRRSTSGWRLCGFASTRQPSSVLLMGVAAPFSKRDFNKLWSPCVTNETAWSRAHSQAVGMFVVRAENARSAMEGELKDLLASSRPLQSIVALLGRVSGSALRPAHRHDAVGFLLRHAYNHAFGNGLDLADTAVPSAEAEAVPDVLAKVEEIRTTFDSPHTLAADQSLLGIALGRPPPAPDLQAPQDLLSRILVDWAWLHRTALARSEGAPDDKSDNPWASSLHQTLLSTGEHLVQAIPEPLDQLLGWLRLRLVLEVVAAWAKRDRGPTTAEVVVSLGETDSLGWRRRAAVAFVARECLRYEAYLAWHRSSSGRVDSESARPPLRVPDFSYQYQPAALLEAVRDLVQIHAEEVVGLPPALDLRSLLEEIGHPHGAEGYLLAAGHLQHVLDVYALGQHLLSLPAMGTNSACTLGALLSSTVTHDPGPYAKSILLRTFSLSVLYHDVGVLLFPRHRGPFPGLYREDEEVRLAMAAVHDALAAVGRDLVRRCVDTLSSEDLVSLKEGSLGRWVDFQARSGQPDHALLGAWHLSRTSADLDDLPQDIVRGAIRAILLHGAPTQVIDTETDPAAALIVLCDEIMDWDPDAHKIPERGTISGQVNAMAAGLAAHRPRVARISWPGLKPALGSGGALQMVSEAGLTEGPHIRLHLNAPQDLEQRVWQIWLSSSQNLSRIKAREGFKPSLEIIGDQPFSSGPLADTKGVLSRLIARSRVPIRGQLQSWWDEVLQKTGTTPPDILMVAAKGRPLASQDIRTHMARLSAEYDALLSDERSRY